MNDPKIEFQNLIDVLETLLAPGGCDWDRKQTHDSLIPYLLEETYEVIEAIERKDMSELREELGDLILHILFQAKLAEQKGYFTISDSLKNISSKLKNRHPHVFSDSNHPDDENKIWEQSKKKEKKRQSILDGVPLTLPALTKARRTQEKASSVGFDWSNINPIWDKINEEINELKEAVESGNDDRITDELGDVIFSFVNLARFLKIDPESSLRHAIKKFEHRFKKIEEIIESQGKHMEDSTLEEMDALWNKIKK